MLLDSSRTDKLRNEMLEKYDDQRRLRNSTLLSKKMLEGSKWPKWNDSDKRRQD